jgi:hypothetical protein
MPISRCDLDKVRAWCVENCEGDYLIYLSRRIMFERHDDAALAAIWWRTEKE